MKIDVSNEVGPLREVLVHRPGQEIVRMTQYDLDRMLFDDILAADEAVLEHDMLAGIMRASGARVLVLSETLEAALAAAPSAATEELVDQCCRLAGATGLQASMVQWEPAVLARALIEGVYWKDVDPAVGSLSRIRSELEEERPLALRPLPNLMFLRDPCISVYDAVVRGRMATSARAREPLLVAFALRHAPISTAPLNFADDVELDESYHCLEGGDVLVLSEQLMMIGCSERTNAHTLERLVREALFPAHPNLQRVYAVMMPAARSVMHLDTILTQVDRRLFLGHVPLIHGPPQSRLSLVRLERDRPAQHLASATVLEVLQEELGDDVGLVPCGGTDPLHQEREQWTDGANAVALGPGHIILYARNHRTVAALAQHGFGEVRLSIEQPEDERMARVREAASHGRVVYTFSGSELSRARGGGRCLTMPLRREALT